MKNVGLVLQGGGFKGIYTSGVLDCFLQHGLHFPYVIGVSAGACNGLAYIAKQKGFGKSMYAKFSNDKRYVGLTNLWKKGSYFNMDCMSEEITEHRSSFDFDTFYQASEEFVVTVTDCTTGEPIYYSKHQCPDIIRTVGASSSLPFVSKMVSLDGRHVLDGGIADPIPIKKSIEDGNRKNVVVLTTRMNPMEKPYLIPWLASIVYADHKELCRSLTSGHMKYNTIIDKIKQLKEEKTVWVLEPSVETKVGYINNSPDQLDSAYELGYNDALKNFDGLLDWLQS